MSISLIASLQALPVEILQHILDDLDAHTILFSFRNICRQFRAIVNNYNRYILNFQSISKPDFDLVCHLIDPCRVTSLILSENDETFDQIKLFLSHFNLRQFNRLRSLSLFIKEEEQLKTIVERFNIRSLESFSLKIEKSDDRRKTTTAKLLSLIIARSNLSKLELYIQEGRFEKILWPDQCSIKHLRIDNIISFDQICIILRCLLHLKTLILNSVSTFNLNQNALNSSLPIPFRQLTSLTFDKMNTTLDDLELFLSLTPSLIHLKLIGYGNYCNGNRWENFIRLNLPLLRKFEFFFYEVKNIQLDHSNIELIIASFQTPFWLEHKQWFVTCECTTDSSAYIKLFSIPICQSFVAYETKKVSMSTLPKMNTNNVSIMDNVDVVKLSFSHSSYIECEQKVYTNCNTVSFCLLRFALLKKEVTIRFCCSDDDVYYINMTTYFICVIVHEIKRFLLSHLSFTVCHLWSKFVFEKNCFLRQ